MSGRVHTVDHDGPSAEAVAVQAGRIVAVGRSTDVRHHVGPRTAIVDLGGRSLVPGFQDAHVHPCTAGVEMGRCDLLNLPADPAAYAAAVATYADANPDLPWIVGKGWAMDAFVGGIAHRSMLDAVVPDRPVYLVNRDGHGAWANTLAFDLADVDAATPDPPDGRIERDATGEPIGTLQEGAMALVGRHTPSPTDSDIDAGILRAEQYLLSLGITAWQDAWVEPAAHAAYVRLGRA
ncbi:MAG: amidohydrolase family protein, partial [Acidimicrobiia bacterium]|nr:amidohydrolase family protein [Acidimicrobiia bacterium]